MTPLALDLLAEAAENATAERGMSAAQSTVAIRRGETQKDLTHEEN